MRHIAANNRHKLAQTNAQQKGFSMVEVLIASIIIAFGILGVISLQLSELRNTRNALVHSQATMLIADITETIRANAAQFESYATLSAEDNDCKSAACTQADIVESDLFNWTDRLTKTLPSGRGIISASAAVMTISIHWQEGNTGATGVNCPPESADDLNCLKVEINI